MASLTGPIHPTPSRFNRWPSVYLEDPFAKFITIKPLPRTWTFLLPRTGASESAKRAKVKERGHKERKEEFNWKVTSHMAISIILRREATKAVIEKKKGTNSKMLLPKTIVEALHK